MNKLSFSIYGLATVFLLASCSQEKQLDVPSDNSRVNITVNAISSKTFVDSDNKVKWSSDGERLHLFQAATTSSTTTITEADSNVGTTGDNGETMSFSVSLDAVTADSFTYYAFYPSSATYSGSSVTSASQVPVTIPSHQTPSASSFDPSADILVAEPVSTDGTQATTLDMAFSRVVAVGKMTLANLDSEEPVTKVTFSANSNGSTAIILAGRSVYDLSSATLSSNNTKATSIVLDYYSQGLNLTASSSMDVWFTCLPFSLEGAGSFTVSVETVDAIFTKTVSLSSAQNLRLVSGKASRFTVDMKSASKTEVTACTSPVEWPVGYSGSTARALRANYIDMWPTNGVGKGVAKESHIWKNVAQSGATATWIVSSDNPTPTNIGFEFNNILTNSGNTANYASPCVKGIWTGDGLEFSIPVKNIKAGTVVTLTLPAFGRGAPIFWNVEYLDGGEWKCNKTLQKSPDDKYEMECTWVIPHGNVTAMWGGHIMTHSFTLTNEIESGFIKIRFVCASGEYTTAAVSAQGNNNCYQGSKCEYSNSRLFAFVNASDECKAVSVSWADPTE